MVGGFSSFRLQGSIMQTRDKVLSVLCFLAASILLLRGLKLLTAGVPALWVSSPGSAYAYGYALGQMTVPVLFIASSVGFLLLGWRRLHVPQAP